MNESLEERVSRLEYKQEDTDKRLDNLEINIKEQERRLNKNDLDVVQINNKLDNLTKITTEVRDNQIAEKEKKDKELQDYKKTIIKTIIGIVVAIVASVLGLSKFL